MGLKAFEKFTKEFTKFFGRGHKEFAVSGVDQGIADSLDQGIFPEDPKGKPAVTPLDIFFRKIGEFENRIPAGDIIFRQGLLGVKVPFF